FTASSVSLFFYLSCHQRDLHSFPTRRSSDLGIFLATWDGTNIDASEDSTSDIGGSTDDLVLSVDINAGQVRFRATAASDNWSVRDRKSTRLNSSHVKISYAVFCLKKKKEQA